MARRRIQQVSWLLPLAGLLCASIPAFSQSADMNYVLTRTMRSADGTVCMDDIQYYDGLGRPVQLVRKGFTPQGNDLATQTDYDDAGRVWREWLPVPFPAGGSYKAGFAANATTEHGDGCPYAETAYEQSPLDRAMKRTGPGAHWHTAGTGISTRYTTNFQSGNYAVKWYSAARPITDRGTYPTGQLLCTETTDENGNVTCSFTDKSGRTVLVRRMNGAEAHDTYYVYDTAGRLRLVLPPMVDGDVSLDNLNRYAYRYEYDDRGNCTFKKLPGRDAVYHVYDRSNRLILEQDGNQRSRGVWKTFKYDRLGRLLYTAEIEGETRGRDALIAEFATYSFIEDFSTGELPYPMGDTGRLQPRQAAGGLLLRQLRLHRADGEERSTGLPIGIRFCGTLQPGEGVADGEADVYPRNGRVLGHGLLLRRAGEPHRRVAHEPPGGGRPLQLPLFFPPAVDRVIPHAQGERERGFHK